MANIPRNPTFRARPVSISVTQGNASINVELKEVTSIKEDTSAGVAVSRGAISPVIQPWYFQPMSVEIQGKSYMGAFSTNRLNVNTDNDVDKLIQVRNLINNAFLTVDAITDLQVILKYGNPGAGSNHGIFQQLVGFIEDLSVEENEGSPYIQSYSFKFVGDLRERFDINRGTQNSNNDKTATASASTPPISKPMGK